MNILEIAKRARVSTATVSRTINRIDTVKPQPSKRVWKAVDELDYFPSMQARALEVKTLRDLWEREAIAHLGIELCSFRDLSAYGAAARPAKRRVN